MTQRIRPAREYLTGGGQFQISKLLVGAGVAAVAVTAGLIVVTAGIVLTPPPPPGPPGGPPPQEGLAVLVVLTGLFVLAWLAVVVALARDQVLRRVRERAGRASDEEAIRDTVVAALSTLRRELAEDRRADVAALETRIGSLASEYGEQRETDGYLRGMRAAYAESQAGAEVRPMRLKQPGP